MASKTVLTGVKPTGSQVHIGNYVGAMRPAIAMANSGDNRSLLFIADYHALIVVQNAQELREYTYGLAASWLACGLDPSRTTVYRQSDVPEIFELAWILGCVTPKGFMNRAHAYKAKVQENREAGREEDAGVSIGLYTYPVLMAADILLFDADEVPVGEDQIQHVEFARDIAEKFNRQFGEVLKLPTYVVQKGSQVIPGLDGRKMSKSYGNTIPLFTPENKLRKLVMKIKTDSSLPEEPKDPSQSLIMDLYKLFASADQISTLERRYREGIGWGEAKQFLFEALNAELSAPRQRYEELMVSTDHLESLLKQGAEKARAMASPVLERVRQAIGR